MKHAPNVDVLLDTGETVALSHLFAERDVVLIFLRHYGCVFCKEHVAQLRLHGDLNVVFVSMGNQEQTRAFRERFRSPHRFIVDPSTALYQAFGLGRGTGKQMFNTKTFSRGFGAVLRGHFVGMPVGDPWQMPGVFVINPAGEITWEYRSVDAADNPDADTIRQGLIRLTHS